MLSRDYDEKRNFIRMAIDCPLQLTLAGGETVPGMARNLSGGGLLIECPQALAEGSVIKVRLMPERSVMAPFEAEAEVVRCEGASGAFMLGVSIRQLLR